MERPIALAGALGGGTAEIWGEWLEGESADCEVLLRYGAGHGWLENQAAMVSRRHGAGRITYLGTWRDHATMDAVVAWCHRCQPFRHAPTALPATVELNRLRDATREIVVAINHGQGAHALPLGEEWSVIAGSRELPANGIGIFSRPAPETV